MVRPRPATALLGAGLAMGAAALANLALLRLAGAALVIPGEMSAAHVVGFTLGCAPFAAVAVVAVPRRFPLLALVVAVATAPFPIIEFGPAPGAWLAAMHVVAGVAAAVIVPRVAHRAARGRSGDLAAA